MSGIIVSCNHCNKEYSVKPYRVSISKYCSRRCLALAARTQITRNCEICNNEFTHISSRSNKAKYCSRKCYYKAMHLKGSVINNCKHCGKEFRSSPSQNRVYCSRACIGKANKSIWNPGFTTVRKSLKRRDLIKKCERCGFDKNLEILGVHHKDRNRKNNKISNLEILCPNCHSLEHAKHIPQGFRE